METPLLLGVLPLVIVGSAQSKSHIIPLSGGSMNLLTYLICFRVTLSSTGNPP